MPRRTKEEAEKTRQAILESALDLFYEKGFSRTTFDEIAKRINLTKGAVYWHFRNKADLLAELIRIKHGKQQAVADVRLGNIKCFEDFRNALIANAEALQNNTEFCRFLFFIIFQMEWSEAIYQRIWDQICDIRDYPFNSLKETLTFLQKNGEIDPAADTGEIAAILVCMWRGLLSAYISKSYPINLVQIMLKSFDLIMDGIKLEKK